MLSRIRFSQVAVGMVGLLVFCLISFSQENQTSSGEPEIEASFLSRPNAAIGPPLEQSGKDVWGDTVYNEAFRLYNKGEYTQAASVYKKACDRYARACTNLGFMHNKGQGVTMSHSLAAEYYQRGCDDGNALGCTNLGIMYWKDDLPKNDRHAVELFERACRNDDSGGCRNLGYMYKHGLGISKDESRAAELYKQADHLSRIHRIPFHVEDGLILVSLTIQDEDAILILDTGSSRTALIRKYLALGYGLPPVQKVITLLGSGQAYPVDISWKLDGREIQLPALVGEFSFPHGAVGILGADVLGMFTSVRFNYSDKVLILED
jgi:TPR repeat protein